MGPKRNRSGSRKRYNVRRTNDAQFYTGLGADDYKIPEGYAPLATACVYVAFKAIDNAYRYKTN